MTSPQPPRRTTGLFVGGGAADDSSTTPSTSAAPTRVSDRAARTRARVGERAAPAGDSTTRLMVIIGLVLAGVGVLVLVLLTMRASRAVVLAEPPSPPSPPARAVPEATAPLPDSVTRPKAPPRTTSGSLINLIVNRNFEELDAQGRPVGWSSQVYAGACDFTVTREGRRGSHAVCVRSTTGGDGAWFTKMSVKPHTAYLMKCWIRCEQLAGSGRGAQINLHVGDVPVDGRSDPLTGTSDWKLVQFLFESGSLNEVQLNCLFGGWGQSTGAAWFDDLELIELSPGR